MQKKRDKFNHVIDQMLYFDQIWPELCLGVVGLIEI